MDPKNEPKTITPTRDQNDHEGPDDQHEKRPEGPQKDESDDLIQGEVK